MKKIDLSSMTQTELFALNHEVVARIKQLRRESRATMDFSQFKVGTVVRSNWNVRPRRLANLQGTIIGLSGSRILVQTEDDCTVRFTPEAITIIGPPKKVAKKARR